MKLKIKKKIRKKSLKKYARSLAFGDHPVCCYSLSQTVSKKKNVRQCHKQTKASREFIKKS